MTWVSGTFKLSVLPVSSSASMAASLRAKIIGLSWRRIPDHRDDDEENDYVASPMTKVKLRRSTGTPLRDRNNRDVDNKNGGTLLKRARSVRDAFGTLRQVRQKIIKI